MEKKKEDEVDGRNSCTESLYGDTRKKTKLFFFNLEIKIRSKDFLGNSEQSY